MSTATTLLFSLNEDVTNRVLRHPALSGRDVFCIYAFGFIQYVSVRVGFSGSGMEVKNTMQHTSLDLNYATYVGIDAHPSEHTAVAVNRFEEEKGVLNFENSGEGVQEFLSWLHHIDRNTHNMVIGIEGRGGKGSGFISPLLDRYEHVYEVNPQYTKQRRAFGTRGGKSDLRDAKLIAEVVIRKLPELPKITQGQLTTRLLILKKLVWHYEKETRFTTRLKNHLRQLQREHRMSVNTAEKKLITQIVHEKQRDLKHMEERQKRLAGKLGAVLSGHEENLTTIPGINTVLAARIAAHTDDLDRFATIDKFLQYGGISPLEKSSGKTKRAVQNNKGNRLLNSTMYMIALNQVNHNPKAKAYYEKKLKEGKTKKHALRCVKKRIAMIIYGMLRSGEGYRG
jgi:transposase